MKKKIILASHGRLSEGMLDSVRMIAGDLPYPSTAYCLATGHSPNEFAEEIETEVKMNPNTEFDIAVDLIGASVCTSLLGLTRYSNVHLFTGMNLNMVLSLFVEHHEDLDEKSIEQITDDAKTGIQNLILSDNSESDEF